MISWDPVEFEGTPIDSECAIPGCHATCEHGGKGLCPTCYQAWYRGGMDGLERRAKRLGSTVQRVQYKRVPLKLDDALELLVDVYEEWMQSESCEEMSPVTRNAIIRICDAIGNIERRRKQRKHRDLFKKNFIRKFGLEAWNKKQAAIQVRYRLRMKDRGYIRVYTKGGSKGRWVKDESLPKQKDGSVVHLNQHISEELNQRAGGG